jgi:biotin carboxyl carrier protein
VNVKLQAEDGVYPGIRTDSGEITVTGQDGSAHHLRVHRISEGEFAVETPQGLRPARAARDGDAIWVHFEGRTYRFDIARERGRRRGTPLGDLSSPMPGQVQRVLVAEGDVVTAGQPLMVVEAMKMQLEIKATHAGRVERLLAQPGQQVEAGAPLVELKAEVEA